MKMWHGVVAGLSGVLGVGAIVALVLVLVMDDDDDGEPGKATVTVTTTVTAEAPGPVAAEPTSSGPNVGDRALTVGQWREGTGIRTRVIKVRQPSEGIPDYLRGDAEATGATVLVRSCVRPGGDATVLSSYNFVARDKSGAVYEASSSSWEVWPPQPQYPFGEREVRAGDCVQGWVLLTTPAGARVTSIELSDGSGGTAAEWRVP